MAPSKDDSDRQRTQDEPTNPFIAFRRFADEHMSTLFNSVFGLQTPFGSSSSSPDRSRKDYEAWLQEARDSRDRLDREAQEMEKIMDIYTRAHNEQQEHSTTQDNVQQPAAEDETPLRCPYRPIEQEVPKYTRPLPFPEVDSHDASHTIPLTPFGMSLPREFLTSSLLGQQTPSISVAYLIFSPYSPARLEQSQALRERGIKWTEAFEDLLAVQSGQDISTGASSRPGTSTSDWLRDMIGIAMREKGKDLQDLMREQRREMQERLQASRSTSETTKRQPGFLDRFANSRQPENDVDEYEDDDGDENGEFDEDDVDDDEEEITELDLYNRFLGFGNTATEPDTIGSLLSQSASRSFAHLQHDSTSTETENNKPSILSTLTTTERTTLQDGTVHTKVVLKKKFADGREESTETVHTQNAVPQGSVQTQQMAKSGERGDSNNESKQEGKEKKSRGWFWS